MNGLLASLALQGGEPFYAVWDFLISDDMDALLARFAGQQFQSIYLLYLPPTHRYPSGSGVTYSLGNSLKAMLRLVLNDELLGGRRVGRNLHSSTGGQEHRSWPRDCP